MNFEKPDLKNPTPLYIQIADSIESKILNQKILVGEYLASETSLTKEFGVNVNTLRKSLAILVKKGYLVRRKSQGTMVINSQAKTPVNIQAGGVLRVHPANPRYFTDDSGKAIYLTGSHTWTNLVDIGFTDPPAAFDYTGYLNFLQQYNHNFIRLWANELFKYSYHGQRYVSPGIWSRTTGQGNALDGKPKFDLTQLNQAYFDRLRARVIAAGDRGIYVSIMLFEGWAIQFADSPGCWDGHPFNINNNVNGINGDPNGDGKGVEAHTLHISAITAIQEAYIRKVIDTVNDLDNVLYEIANEDGGSADWQYYMINYIKKYESGKPKQHPVGMTCRAASGSNPELFTSAADWISPLATGEYDKNPPAAAGQKVIILDTDHLGCNQDGDWVWKSFCRGHNPILMDVIASLNGGINGAPDFLNAESARKNMGYALTYANKMNLAAMTPQDSLASSGYCLMNAVSSGAEYLVYIPNGGSVTVNLSAASDTFSIEWLNPATGRAISRGTITGGANRSFTPPFSGDAVLYLKGNRTSGQSPYLGSAFEIPCKIQV